MTPVTHTCDHACCADDGPHSHFEPPELCVECLAVEEIRSGKHGPRLRARAQRIADMKATKGRNDG